MLVSKEHPLFQLENKKRLASILKSDPEYFKDIESFYKVYPFKKIVGNKERELFNTELRYKYLLRKLNKLLCHVNIPDYVYAGVPKKDFLNNALVHSKNLYIQNVDIKNFFPSTSDSFVYGLFFHKFNTSPDVAKILSLLTTYPNHRKTSRHIPQGFPTSTILSFLSYFDLFNGIDNICKLNGIHFTLFVDDMTFSSNRRIPKSFLKHVSTIVRKYNLELHPSKIYRNGPYKYKNVTGVIIDPMDKTLKAPNRLQKRMYDNYQAIHNYSINSFSDYIQFKQLVLKTDGQLRAIKRIESHREFTYITKVLKDIKSNFLHPSVKGAPRDILLAELDLFYKEDL